MKPFVTCLSGMAVGLLTGSVAAQWSSNSAANLTLADLGNEQVQPKIRASLDGGCYVSWYDNSAGGYDVYLQRLNKTGVEQWAHNGILIANRSVSSTVDYGLAVDSGNNAIIAFVDDRFGAGRITAQKVDKAGNLLWNGTDGANAGAGSTTGSPPQVAVLSDGNYAVIWNNTAASPVGTLIQKLDANGVTQFPGNGILQNDTQSPQRPLQACDVEAGDNGSIIVLFVRCTGSNCVTSNKQLYIQKYDSNGAALWNAGVPMALMGSTSSIQTGYFPRFLPDGSGGAVLGWYEITSNARNAYIQHVLTNGTLKFAQPLPNAITGSDRIRVGAGLAYNQNTGEYFLASPETDAAFQSQNSVFVQRYSSTGSLMWGNGGVTLLAITSATQPSFVQCQVMGDGVEVFWEQTTSATTRVIAGARVQADQTIAWNELLASDGTTDKSRLDSAVSACGYAMVAFGNGSTGSVDIQAQNVLLSGVLGNPPARLGDLNCDGVVNFEDIAAFTTALADAGGYALQFPCCPIAQSDLNGDSVMNGQDISQFVQCLLGSCPP